MRRLPFLVLLIATSAAADDRWPAPDPALKGTPGKPVVVRWVARSGDPILFEIVTEGSEGVLRARWRDAKNEEYLTELVRHPGATGDRRMVEQRGGDEITYVHHEYIDGGADKYQGWRLAFKSGKGFRIAKKGTWTGKQPVPAWAWPKMSKDPVQVAADTVGYLTRMQAAYEGLPLYFDAETVPVSTKGKDGKAIETNVSGEEVVGGWQRAGVYPVLPHDAKCAKGCCTSAGKGWETWYRIESVCFSADKDRAKVRKLVVVDPR